MEAISFPQRGVDTLAKRGPLVEGTASTSNNHPHPKVTVVVDSSNGGNDIPMEDQIKGISGGLGEASSQNSSTELGTSISNQLGKCSTPSDSLQAVAAEEVEPLFGKQGEAVQRPIATTKRKAGTLENAGILAGRDQNVASRKKKRAMRDSPNYTEDSPTRYLSVCDQLSARAQDRRGYPRVVDLESFTNNSNKEYFTMADIVATILWHHNPKSLKAFLDTKTRHIFSFVRKESDKKGQNSVIERREEETGTKVIVSRFGCYPRTGRLMHPSRSATMLQAQAISGMDTTSILSKQAENGIQSVIESAQFQL